MIGQSSLRVRLSLAAILSILAAVTLAGFFLLLVFERHVTRRVDQELVVYIKQLIAALELDDTGRAVLRSKPADPRFRRPLSGLYWQIEDQNGVALRSRSLWDQSLQLSELDPKQQLVQQYTLAGDDGAPLVVRSQTVFLETSTGDRPFRVSAALNKSEITAARQAFRWDVIRALGLLGLVLCAAAGLQIFFGLRPLSQIRDRISDVRAGQAGRLEGAFPSEVQGLVSEVNALMTANERAVTRARDSAADLAHGLKTPLAVLQAEGRRLADHNQPEAATEIEDQVEQMRRRVERHLAVVRLRGQASGAPGRTELKASFEKIVKAMRAQPDGDALSWTISVKTPVTVAMDTQDFFEVFGNLLDNARKWASSKVTIEARITPSETIIEISDDGPGIDEDHLDDVVQRGGRLDERKTGAGLGLTIADKILHAYGASLELRRAGAGGLLVRVTVPNPEVTTS